MPRRGTDTAQADIPIVSFRKRREPSLEFEVVRLANLFQRRFRRPLDEPQRLGFYQVFQATRGEGLYTVDFRTHSFRTGDLVEPLLRSMLRTILLQAECIKESIASAASVAQFPRFLLFKNSVERNFRSMRKVSGYAAELGVSARNLNRVTRVAVGLDAKDFIDARVMLELKRLLAYTDDGLKEIAAALGFDEPTNLVKYFRQRVHVTPMEFRSAWRARGAFLS